MSTSATPIGSSPIHSFLTSVDSLDLSEAGRRTALQALVRSALKIGEDNIQYYESVRNRQNYWSRALRIGMVTFGGLGFLSPLLKPWVASGSDYGYVFLALAAVCITTNSVFAASSNQSRFLLSRFRLEKLVADFRLTITATELSWNDKSISDDQLTAMIDSTKEFLSAVFELIINETTEWSTEIHGAIEEISRKIDSSSNKTRS